MDQPQLRDLARHVVTFAAPLITSGALAEIDDQPTDTHLIWLRDAWS